MNTVVGMVLTVTLVMVLDYWWLNLQSLTLVAICNFGHSGISIGEDGLSIDESGDVYKLGEGFNSLYTLIGDESHQSQWSRKHYYNS